MIGTQTQKPGFSFENSVFFLCFYATRYLSTPGLMLTNFGNQSEGNAIVQVNHYFCRNSFGLIYEKRQSHF